MYCVKCGVRLQEGVKECPLCQTPVWNPAGAIALTVLCLVASLVTLIVCMKLYGELRWGGYVILGIALFYVVAALPRWFRHPLGEVFVPVDHGAAALYLLYICLKTGGHWYLSFALPVILFSCLLSTAMVCLLKYLKKGRCFIFGGFLMLLIFTASMAQIAQEFSLKSCSLLVVIGCSNMLVEFFEHLSFGTQMFRWSLYSLSCLAIAGIFLLLAGMIPTLRHVLKKNFFF